MNEEEEEPETARILDEVHDFIRDHVIVDDSARRIMTLYAAMTWGMPEMCPTVGRLLITTRLPGLEGKSHGKTTAMDVVAALSCNPQDARGTYASLRAKLANAANQADNPSRTFYHDRVEQVYGTSGTNRGGNATLTLLLEAGYKEGAHDSWSRGGSEQDFSLFFPVVVTANGTGLPSDLRQRCIVVVMPKGKPRRYFSVRESQAEARKLGKALGAVVKAHIPELQEFRARGIHEKLDERLLEVWEGVFAIAKVLGGQRWLNWCLEAFQGLALNTEQSALSPRQEVLRDIAGLLDEVSVMLPSGKEFAEGMKLANRMIVMPNELYNRKTALGVAGMIADAMPSSPKQVRVGSSRMNGYYAEDVRASWDVIKPADYVDAQIPEAVNPFEVKAVKDEDFDEVFEIPPKPVNVRVSAKSGNRRK